MERELSPVAVASGRVAARLARQVEVGLGQVDLSLPQYRILMFLDEGATVASKLADHLAVSRPTITAVVDGLVARGLVERRPHDQDRRRVGHALTEAGRQLLQEADRSVDARLRVDRRPPGRRGAGATRRSRGLDVLAPGARLLPGGVAPWTGPAS